VAVAGVLLGGGASRRFGAPKLEALLEGERLLDRACRHFLEAGLGPVVFAGRGRPRDARVLVVEPGPTMIETLRSGLRALPPGPFAFAPADMPALAPDLVRELLQAFLASGRPYLVPVFEGRRGHPAFAASSRPFFELGDARGAREVWGAAGTGLVHHPVATADVLFDVDEPLDLAAAGSEEARRARLVERGTLPG
jgi:CTP:molybdopterin cytidylyltransferase MocA